MAEALGRRERRKLEINTRILDAARQLLSEKPLEEVAVEAICELADVSKKTFYNYYSSRQDVVEQLSDSLLISESDKNYQLAIDKFDNTKERLEYFLSLQGRNLSDSIQLEKNLITSALLDVSVNPERSRAKLENTTHQFEKLFEAGQKLGDVNDKYSPRFLAETISGIVNTTAIHWIHFKDYPVNQRYKEIRQVIMDIALKK